MSFVKGWKGTDVIAKEAKITEENISKLLNKKTMKTKKEILNEELCDDILIIINQEDKLIEQRYFKKYILDTMGIYAKQFAEKENESLKLRFETLKQEHEKLKDDYLKKEYVLSEFSSKLKKQFAIEQLKEVLNNGQFYAVHPLHQAYIQKQIYKLEDGN